ncbi:MAG: hypothetical protein R2849_02380 [Thermomicrobiales bacterium]
MGQLLRSDTQRVPPSYNFGLLKAAWNAGEIRSLIETIESVVPADAWPNWVIGNHDEQRVASRLGPAGARAAMTSC